LTAAPREEEEKRERGGEGKLRGGKIDTTISNVHL